jgi:hypothetical protein
MLLVVAALYICVMCGCDEAPKNPPPPRPLVVSGTVEEIRLAGDKRNFTYVIFRHDNGMITTITLTDPLPPIHEGDHVRMQFEVYDAKAGIYNNLMVQRRFYP